METRKKPAGGMYASVGVIKHNQDVMPGAGVNSQQPAVTQHYQCKLTQKVLSVTVIVNYLLLSVCENLDWIGQFISRFDSISMFCF